MGLNGKTYDFHAREECILAFRFRQKATRLIFVNVKNQQNNARRLAEFNCKKGFEPTINGFLCCRLLH